MKLDRVTITGADDSISPHSLMTLSEAYPYVEWGILVSASQSRTPRFPSYRWVQELVRLAKEQTVPPKLSLHVCGRWTRQFLIGIVEQGLSECIFDEFQRIQLNFHAERTDCKPLLFNRALRQFPTKEFIFQIDGAGGNDHFESALVMENRNCVSLYDISGGAGVLPEEWPKPFWILDNKLQYHGYAGGLGPDNLAEQLPLIAEAAGDCRIWIDCETRVRSENDSRFDLDKVLRFIKIAQPFVDA